MKPSWKGDGTVSAGWDTALLPAGPGRGRAVVPALPDRAVPGEEGPVGRSRSARCGPCRSAGRSAAGTR